MEDREGCMPGCAAHTADALSENVPGCIALLLKCQSPTEGEVCTSKDRHQPVCSVIQGITCEKSNYSHNAFWLMLKFVTCIQARISSPLRVDEDEVCVAIYELHIVQIVLPGNLKIIYFNKFW